MYTWQFHEKLFIFSDEITDIEYLFYAHLSKFIQFHIVEKFEKHLKILKELQVLKFVCS